MIRSIERCNVPLNAYLRADPYSQLFQYSDNGEKLVTDDMFWGEENNTQNRLYLDYSKIPVKSIEVSEGISERQYKQVVNDVDCEKWINNNLLNKDITRLYVIQGYAGCGKTTFINRIKKSSSCFSYIYIDIGSDWSYSEEPYLFFNESLNELYSALEEISKMNDRREEIWDYFISLGLNSRRFDLSLVSVFSAFKKLKRDSTWEDLITDIINYLTEKYSEQYIIINGKHKESEKHSIGRTTIIVSLIMLLNCAKSIILEYSAEQTYSIIFDNLDVITNPAIPAENVMDLWGVIDRYCDFKKSLQNKTNQKLPNFQIIITVRKVLYSHIVSYLPILEMPISHDQSMINVCDISNLYSSQEVLANRIMFWEQNSNHIEKEKLIKLKSIIRIHDVDSSISKDLDEKDFSLRTTINLDAFLNHNYRAFSNILSILIEDDRYYALVERDFSNQSSSKDWQKVSTIIFIMSLIYKKNKVWTSLGFGCKDFDTIDYPTTLNRLILNYLYLAKRGRDVRQRTVSNIRKFPEEDSISLEDLLKTLKKAVFLSVKTHEVNEEFEKKYIANSVSDSECLIIGRLADMCARNPVDICSKTTGYDSDDDELWRRPLYFIGGVRLSHTASSYEELKSYFQTCIDSKRANDVLFSITDEGFILIKDIVASFEFYSARYCNERYGKPLHYAKKTKELNNRIQPVYNAIQKCCERNIVFENHYCDSYDIVNRDDYLMQFFHPRTNPHYKKGSNELKDFSFRPQLHIVRVIYNHIHYFDSIKELISFSNYYSKNAMCKCLTTWIEKYLILYKEFFYDKQIGTVCNPDNNVYDDLWGLLEEQKKHYVKGGDFRNIRIMIQRRN